MSYFNLAAARVDRRRSENIQFAIAEHPRTQRRASSPPDFTRVQETTSGIWTRRVSISSFTSALPATMSRSMTPSIASRTNVGYRVRNMSFLAKPTIEIHLENTRGPHGDYVTSYSSMDKIQGVVRVSVDKDTRFDDIEITFEGRLTLDSSDDVIYEC